MSRAKSMVGCAGLTTIAGDGADLVFVDVARVVEQAADEGGLAVVDAAGGGEAQQILRLLRRRGTLRWRKSFSSGSDEYRSRDVDI